MYVKVVLAQEISRKKREVYLNASIVNCFVIQLPRMKLHLLRISWYRTNAIRERSFLSYHRLVNNEKKDLQALAYWHHIG